MFPIPRPFTPLIQNLFTRISLLALGGLVITSASAETAADRHEMEMHHHVPGVFFGVTSGGGESTFTTGLEYEYLLTRKVGLGAVYERSPERHHGDAVNSGISRAVFDLQDVKQLDMALIKLLLSAMQACREVALEHVLIGSAALAQECNSYEDTRSWHFFESIEASTESPILADASSA